MSRPPRSPVSSGISTKPIGRIAGTVQRGRSSYEPKVDVLRRTMIRVRPDIHLALIDRVGETELERSFGVKEWKVIASVAYNEKWDDLTDALINDDYEAILSHQDAIALFYDEESEFIRLLRPWFFGLVGIELWNNDLSHVNRLNADEVIGFVHSAEAAWELAKKVQDPKALVKILPYRAEHERLGIALVLYALQGYERWAVASILSLSDEDIRDEGLIILTSYPLSKVESLSEILIDEGNGDDLSLLLRYGNISFSTALIDSLATKLLSLDSWNGNHWSLIDEIRQNSYYRLSSLMRDDQSLLGNLAAEIDKTKRGDI